MFGFMLRRLALIGPGKPPAEVVFKRGLNIIAGPSDTGKSFIVQCLDYVLGGGDAPKDIPEVDGYRTVILEIESNQDRCVYVLERSLRGGNVRCVTEGKPDRILAAKHQGGKEDTVSQFLLNLSGLGVKKVRTNQDGKTRPLSFRDMAPLVIIDEESVIKDMSPILSGEGFFRTEESGVFRLLLTGVDDSSVIAKENAKIAKGRQTGKIEILERLLKGVREQIAGLGVEGGISEESDRLARITEALQAAIAERKAAQISAMPLEAQRRAAWSALRAVDSRINVLHELQTRFDLLHEQYSSDLRRLEAIAEASGRLGQLKEERCPMCGTPAEHHDRACREARPFLVDASQACKAEAAKTQKLLLDLKATQASTTIEMGKLQEVRNDRQGALDAVATQLSALLTQHVDVLVRKVDELQARMEICRKAVELLGYAQELETFLKEANAPKKKEKAKDLVSAVSTAQATSFSKTVEMLLRAWHFPGLDRVSFSEDDQDVVVSGRARKSHGKGVRAILRAAFNLALLHLCVKEDRPFPNFVLIDSPLLVYEEPDAGESSFPQDIKKHFWESVKSSFGDAQVIIIENSRQLPGEGFADDVNVVLFTGNDHGRRGLVSAAARSG